MPGTHLVILNSGGLRSLVATAITLANTTPGPAPGSASSGSAAASAGPAASPGAGAGDTRITLLHINDGRDTAAIRMEQVRKQAHHFQLDRIIRLEMTELFTHARPGIDGRPVGSIVLPRLLLAALAYAKQHQAQRVIWPGSCDGESRTLAQYSETMLLCEHLAQLDDPDHPPRLDTPLMEMSDRQIIELGESLRVPWTFARTCLAAASHACQVCPACRRRQAAFAAAGLVDPAEKMVMA